MNLGPVESKRVSSASSVEGETTPDEKRGILAILTEKNSLLIKSLFIRVLCFFFNCDSGISLLNSAFFLPFQ